MLFQIRHMNDNPGNIGRDWSVTTLERISDRARYVSKTWMMLLTFFLFVLSVATVLPEQSQRS